MSRDLLDVFRETICSYDMLAPGDRVLLAVSGGPDSIVLAHLFKRLGEYPLGAFHLNHGFREESKEELVFVQELMKSWGIPCHTFAYDVVGYLQRTGISPELGARRVRYRLLNECFREYGYTKAALGHHADDQAETVLMRLIRGTGIRGLGGIRPVRGIYIRPLLRITKEEIMDYCRKWKLPFCQDATNFEPIYFRNKLRLELIPLLEKEYNPRIRASLCRLAESALADDLELDAQTKKLASQYIFRKNGKITLLRSSLRELSVSLQRRLLRAFVEEILGEGQAIDFLHIERLRQKALAPEPFTLQLPTISVIGNANYLMFRDEQDNLNTGELYESTEIPLEGQLSWGQFELRSKVWEAKSLPPRGIHGWIEDFALEDLALPLLIRTRQDGDGLRVFGRGNYKKLKDLFIDQKIPREERDCWPVICDQKEIIWVPGVRRAEKGRITPETAKILRLTVLGS